MKEREMKEYEIVNRIITNNGDCTGIKCIKCPFDPKACFDDMAIMEMASQWLTDHRETQSKQNTNAVNITFNLRRYEIAKGIYHVFIKDEDNGIYNNPSEAAAYTLMYADALIAELDKTEDRFVMSDLK